MLRYLTSLLVWLAIALSPAAFAGFVPKYGRFLQADPNASGLTVVSDAGWYHGRAPSVQAWEPSLRTRTANGLHLSQYVGSDPVSRSDPLGLSYDMFDEVEAIAAEHTFSGLVGLQVAKDHARGELKKLRAYERAAFQWDELVMDRDEAILFSVIGSPFFSTICFEEGTPIVGTDGSSSPIESVQLGSAVFSIQDPFSIPPSEQGVDPDSYKTIDSAGWRAVSVESTGGGGGRVSATLLRPLQWVEATGAAAGRELPVDFHEFDLAGPLVVTAVSPAPVVASGGAGSSVVTGVFRTEKRPIVRVWLYGEDKSIGVTPTHPFFDHQRQVWIPAAELKPGDQVRTFSGFASVVRVEDRGETATVYNIETHRTHTYFAGAEGAWVHNPCFGKGPSRIFAKMNDRLLSVTVSELGSLAEFVPLLRQAIKWGLRNNAVRGLLDTGTVMNVQLARALREAADKGLRFEGAKVIDLENGSFRLLWDAFQ